MIAKKSLGQHWLDDDASLITICDTAELTGNDTVLEIGPGQGSLTKKLVERAGQVIAVEKDATLVQKLSGSFKIAKNLQFIEGDILKFDLTTLPAGYKVVANIPYYLTNNLLRILCESPNPPSVMALLVQKEVAERITAKPGHMSLLSISVQFYCETRLGPVVPAHLFIPPPKVDSQIVKLSYRFKPLFPDIEPRQFFRLVKAGFATRRKMLLNSLKAGLQLDKIQVEQLLKKAKINPQARAQELSLGQWYDLYNLLK